MYLYIYIYIYAVLSKNASDSKVRSFQTSGALRHARRPRMCPGWCTKAPHHRRIYGPFSAGECKKLPTPYINPCFASVLVMENITHNQSNLCTADDQPVVGCGGNVGLLVYSQVMLRELCATCSASSFHPFQVTGANTIGTWWNTQAHAT